MNGIILMAALFRLSGNKLGLTKCSKLQVQSFAHGPNAARDGSQVGPQIETEFVTWRVVLSWGVPGASAVS